MISNLAILQKMNYSQAVSGVKVLPKSTDGLLDRVLLKIIPYWIRPNDITLIRFVMIPFVGILLFNRIYDTGIMLFAFALFTDIIDGALARLRNQITEWGKFFDPFADKLLIGTVVAIVVSQYISVYVAAVIIFAEIILMVNAFYQMKFRGYVVPSKIAGKVKMFLQSMGLLLLLIYVMTPSPVVLVAATYMLYLSIIFSLLSIFTYRHA
ncbi:MAG: CDP-alcohol phosphatidyltransferase family protein [Candidatus Paceibacterota bacterium]